MKMISVPFFIRRSVYHPRQRISYPQGISSVTDAPRGSRNEFDEFRGMGRERISLNPRLAFASRGFRIGADDRLDARARRATGSLAPEQSQNQSPRGRARVLCLRKRKQDRFEQEAVRLKSVGTDFAVPTLFNGADDRSRTGTGVESHRILSPRRLPIPPHRLDMQSTV